MLKQNQLLLSSAAFFSAPTEEDLMALDGYDYPHDEEQGEEHEQQPILWLPSEVLSYIFCFISAKDLGRVSQACTYFREVASAEFLWKRQCLLLPNFRELCMLWRFVRLFLPKEVHLRPRSRKTLTAAPPKPQESRNDCNQPEEKEAEVVSSSTSTQSAEDKHVRKAVTPLSQIGRRVRRRKSVTSTTSANKHNENILLTEEEEEVDWREFYLWVRENVVLVTFNLFRDDPSPQRASDQETDEQRQQQQTQTPASSHRLVDMWRANGRGRRNTRRLWRGGSLLMGNSAYASSESNGNGGGTRMERHSVEVHRKMTIKQVRLWVSLWLMWPPHQLTIYEASRKENEAPKLLDSFYRETPYSKCSVEDMLHSLRKSPPLHIHLNYHSFLSSSLSSSSTAASSPSNPSSASTNASQATPATCLPSSTRLLTFAE
ncbi:hypothetical protein QOT17_014133 [Balamuthia mandrillaris]